MKFAELIELADRIVEKTGVYTSVESEYSNHPNGLTELRYNFYQANGQTIKFNTAQLLKAHMENILNPVADEGVELEEKEPTDG